MLLLRWEQRILEYEFWAGNGQFPNTPVIHFSLKGRWQECGLIPYLNFNIEFAC